MTKSEKMLVIGAGLTVLAAIATTKTGRAILAAQFRAAGTSCATALLMGGGVAVIAEIISAFQGEAPATPPETPAPATVTPEDIAAVKAGGHGWDDEIVVGRVPAPELDPANNGR